MVQKKRRSDKLTEEGILKLVNNKAVTILLDFEGNSEEAKMGCSFSYGSKSKILTVVATLVNDDKKELLFQIIKKVFNGGGIILKKSEKETLESYIDYTQHNSNDKSILEFFDGIIPKNDYYALKMSLYLRDQQLNGKNIHEYKKSIRERFGDRGANIANLCSAGYFEQEFLPMFYNSVSKEEFNEYYEIAVGKRARALFIHSRMGIDEIEEEFDIMVNKAIKYHMGDFRVHGLGTQNVQTIKAFFQNKQADPENRYIFKKDYELAQPNPVIVYVINIL